MDTDSLSEKGFAETAFISEKNKFQIGLTKSYFLRYLTHFLRKAVKVLTFAISLCSIGISEIYFLV